MLHQINGETAIEVVNLVSPVGDNSRLKKPVNRVTFRCMTLNGWVFALPPLSHPEHFVRAYSMGTSNEEVNISDGVLVGFQAGEAFSTVSGDLRDTCDDYTLWSTSSGRKTEDALRSSYRPTILHGIQSSWAVEIVVNPMVHNADTHLGEYAGWLAD